MEPLRFSFDIVPLDKKSPEYDFRLDVLGAADGSRAFASLAKPISTQMEELAKVTAGSSTVSATALFDPPNNQTHFCLFSDDIFGEPCPSANMGDSKELLHYHRRAEKLAPSKKHIKIFSGHGLGSLDGMGETALSRSRCLNPDGSHKDFLEADEVARFIAETNPVVVVFDACLMSNLESLAQLYARGFRGFAVGALDEMSAKGLPLKDAAITIRNACESGFCSDLLAAQAFVAPYKGALPTDTALAFDLSSRFFPQGIEAFAVFVRGLSRSPSSSHSLVQAFQQASLRSFRRGGLCDLGFLAQALQASSYPSNLLNPLNAAVQHFQSCLLARKVGTAYTNALGLSLFCPSSRHQLQQERNLRSLAFEQATGWLSFLEGRLS